LQVAGHCGDIVDLLAQRVLLVNFCERLIKFAAVCFNDRQTEECGAAVAVAARLVRDLL
jgi:hypothetical protein